MPELDEEMQTAQARPNLYDNVPGASPRPPGPGAATPAPPPKTTPGGTPIGSPSGGLLELEEPEVKKRPNAFGGQKSRDATRFLQDMNKDITGKHTIDIPDDHGRNTQYPEDKDDLESWYSHLSKEHQRMANDFQREILEKKKYSGWFDPKIKGDDLKLRNYLFDQTSGQWRRKVEPNRHPKSSAPGAPAGPRDTKDPESFFGKGKRSELKDDAPAIASMGGNYMYEGEA